MIIAIFIFKDSGKSGKVHVLQRGYIFLKSHGKHANNIMSLKRQVHVATIGVVFRVSMSGGNELKKSI